MNTVNVRVGGLVKRRIMAAMSKNDIPTKVELNLPPEASPGRGIVPALSAELEAKY